MTREQIRAELNLFKAYTDEKSVIQEDVINEELLQKGIVVTQPVPEDVKEEIISLYGIKDEWNNTFHKSFSTVINTPIEVLVAQQILHYFTT